MHVLFSCHRECGCSVLYVTMTTLLMIQGGNITKRRRLDGYPFVGIPHPHNKRKGEALENEIAKKRRKVTQTSRCDKKRPRGEENELREDNTKRARVELSQGKKRKWVECERGECSASSSSSPKESDEFGDFQYWRQKLPSLEEVERFLNR